MSATKPKTDTTAELSKIIKRQEDKIEKLQKTIEEKNKIIRDKEERLSKVDEKIEQLEGIAAKAQQEVQNTDAKHSDEMELVLNRINELAARIK